MEKADSSQETWKYEHLAGVFSEGRCVCRMDWEIQDEVDARNGRIIAAALDLIAALKSVLSEETVGVHVGYDSGGNYVYAEAVRTDSDAFNLARAALSKAEGRS